MSGSLPRPWRFANPKATRTVDLGACACPGTPHDHDSAEVRTQVGAGEKLAIFAAGGFDLASPDYDPISADTEALVRLTRSWTMVDEEGQPVPITRETVELLDDETRTALGEACREAIYGGGSLPNGSGAPSRATSRGSASRTRQTRRSR